MAYRRVSSPHSSSTPRRSYHFSWRHLLTRRVLMWALTAIGICFLLSAGVVLWWSKDLPDPQNIEVSQSKESTKILDRTGTHVLYQFGDIHRTKIALNDISPLLRQATLAAEDDKFYQHHGVELTSILRALLVDIRGGQTQGGSTITQQLVKNAILTPERTLQRKIKEAVLSIELEQRFSKDQIFEMYLNDIPYGNQ